MKNSTKSSRLYTELRNSILQRHIKPGTMLQREIELAKSYNVSRDTLRSALARLEKKSLIRRVRGKGTYLDSYTEYVLPTLGVGFRVFVGKPF